MKRVCSFFLLTILLATMVFGALPANAASAAPKAPTSVTYRLDTVGGGKADGVVSVVLPTNHGADDIYLYWGNASGKLPGYTALTPFKVSGNVVNHRMAAGSFIPQGATRLLAYTYSDQGGFSTTYASFALPEGAALTAADLGTLSFEFQSVSDLHVTSTAADRTYHAEYNAHVTAMLQDIVKNSPNSIGIFNNGDTVDGGHDAEYAEFSKIYNAVAGAPAIYSAFGNHETFRYGTPPTDSNFTNIKNPYYNTLCKNLPSDTVFSAGTKFGSLTFAFRKNGCKFIFVGTDVLDQNYIELSASTITWIEQQIKDERNANRPVFVLMHQPMDNTLSGTYAGTNHWNGKGWGHVEATTATALQAMFRKYPEVILFDGHTHWDLDEYGTFYPRDSVYPNMFATASVGYLWDAYDSIVGEELVGGQGYYVYVYGSKILVRGRDFVNGTWVASAQFLVDLTDAGLATTPKKVTAAPLYGSTASLTVSGSSVSGQVVCYLPVHHNATSVALYFASADSGILSTQPFATASVSTNLSVTTTVKVASATLPANADYILVYAYSGTLGFSASCDVIELDTLLTGGGAPASGNLTINKYSFAYGDPIYVTAHKGGGTSWVGFRNVASSSAKAMNYYYISDVGVGTAVNINAANSAFGYTFAKLTPGVYEVAWFSTDGAFTTRTPENTTTIVVHGGNLSESGYVSTDKSVYIQGEPIYVTALGGNTADWIGMQVKGYENNNAKLWYYVSVSGMNTAFDITKSSNFSNNGSTNKFATLDVGTYELAWIDDSKSVFKTGKEAKHTVTLQIIEEPTVAQLGTPTLTVVKNPVLTALLSQITAAEALIARDYTTETWQAFLTAFNAAKRVRNSDTTTQTEVDAATADLQTAIAALVPLNSGASSETNSGADGGAEAEPGTSASDNLLSPPTTQTPNANPLQTLLQNPIVWVVLAGVVLAVLIAIGVAIRLKDR